MTAPAVLVGSGYGPVGLFDTAADVLRDQVRARGVALVSVSRECRAGVGVAAAVAAERAAVRAVARRCERVVATVENDPPGRAHDLLAELGHVTDCPVDARLVVERQDRLAEHLVQAGIRAGRTDPVPADFAHDHANSVRTLRELPFVGSVGVRPYELVAADPVTWVDDALGLAGLSGSLDLRPLARAVLAPYRQWRAVGVELAAALLPELAGVADRELLHDFLDVAFAARGDDRPLGPDARVVIVERHREANRAFFAEFGRGLPTDGYDDDEATARLGTLARVVTVPGPPLATRTRKVAGRVKRAALRRLPLTE